MRAETSVNWESDGRRQRSETSRKRIVKAVLELIEAGEVAPSAESVAVRAGLGLRTVFRHFENMESLYQELNAVMRAELLPVAAQPFEAADWRGQLSEVVERRSRIFERLMPFKTAADVHRHRSPFLARQAEMLVREQRAVLTRIVPAEQREDDDFIEVLDLLFSFETWRRLRKDQGLSVPRAKRVLETLLEPLLKDR
jgi:AcrR family transcriptional regulator